MYSLTHFLRFSVGLELSLTWHDYRLTFADLNEASTDNVVDLNTVKDNIWLPKVSFMP